MNIKIRPQLAEEADCCPSCNKEVLPEHVYQLGDAFETVDSVDATFFHTKCEECGELWDEHYGWN